MKELYRFWTTDAEWRYTNADVDITYLSESYLSIPIDRSEISFEFDKVEAKIIMPYDYEPASLFRALNPSNALWIEVLDYDNSVKIFTGKVVSCSFDPLEAKATLNSISVQSLLTSGIPVRTFSYSCTNNLFDTRCGVNRSSFVKILSLTDIVRSGNTMQHAVFATESNGYFSWGEVIAGGESSFIIDHVGDTITLLTQIQTSASVTTYIYAGCNRTRAICISKFSNEISFGGFRHLPMTNIFIDGW